MCSRRRSSSRLAALAAAAVLSAWGPFCAGQTLDCLLARVNEQPVTLLDVRVLEAFGLFEAEAAPGPRAVLDGWIDLKIVIDLVRERVSISPERIASARDEALSRLGAVRARELLSAFGLEADDLLSYFEQKLIFQEIISMRFGRSTIVTLKEIETYYQETFVPAARLRGEEPRAILEVLDALEAFLKAEKIKGQVDSWVQNLKRQAEVEILAECLKCLDKE